MNLLIRINFVKPNWIRTLRNWTSRIQVSYGFKSQSNFLRTENHALHCYCANAHGAAANWKIAKIATCCTDIASFLTLTLVRFQPQIASKIDSLKIIGKRREGNREGGSEYTGRPPDVWQVRTGEVRSWIAGEYSEISTNSLLHLCMSLVSWRWEVSRSPTRIMLQYISSSSSIFSCSLFSSSLLFLLFLFL